MQRSAFPGTSYSWIYSPIFISCFLGVVAILSVLSVHQSRQAAVRAYHIQELMLEKRQLQHANAQLSCEIARLEALPRIEKRAREMSLAPAVAVSYVAVTGSRQPQPVALSASQAAVPNSSPDVRLEPANPGENQILAIALPKKANLLNSSDWWRNILAAFTDWTKPAAQNWE